MHLHHRRRRSRTMAQLVAWRTAQPGRTNPQPDLENYRFCELLGEGTYVCCLVLHLCAVFIPPRYRFGVVHRAQDITTGRTVAIKRLRLDPSEEGVPGHTMREISFLRSMCHDNIVQVGESCVMVVVYERALNDAAHDTVVPYSHLHHRCHHNGDIPPVWSSTHSSLMSTAVATASTSSLSRSTATCGATSTRCSRPPARRPHPPWW